MTRDVDLVSYLPPFMADFREMSETLKAENSQFKIVWDATDRALSNEFIATADEYGISRFESILGILPSKEDTLESRRTRVQMRWFTTIPYTLKSLISKMVSLCGESDFSVTVESDRYRVTVETAFEQYGQTDEVEKLLDTMIPCNMVVVSYNRLCSNPGCKTYVGGVVTQSTEMVINTKTNDEQTISGGLAYAAYVAAHIGVDIDTTP